MSNSKPLRSLCPAVALEAVVPCTLYNFNLLARRVGDEYEFMIDQMLSLLADPTCLPSLRKDSIRHSAELIELGVNKLDQWR